MLATHRRGARACTRGERVVALEPVELARCRRACPRPALVLRLPEERERRGELPAGLVEPPGLPVQAPDARVRGAALAPQIEPPRARQHLDERAVRLVVAPERLEDVAVVVERLEAQVLVGGVALLEQREPPGEELRRLRVRVARARHSRRPRTYDDAASADGARLLAVAREHLEVLLARVGALAER